MASKKLVGSTYALIAVGFSIGVTLLTFVLDHVPFVENFELKTLDLRFQTRQPRKSPAPGMVLVGITDSSIAAVGRWPWPRMVQATFLKEVDKLNPAVFALDIFFTEPDTENTLSDSLFIQTVTTLKTPVVMASAVTRDEGPLDKWLEPHTQKEEGTHPGYQMLLPIAELQPKIIPGFVDILRDRDGVARRVPLVIKNGSHILPSFALSAVLAKWKVDFKQVTVEWGRRVVVPRPEGVVYIPIDSEGRFLINFRGPVQTFKPIAFEETGDLLESPKPGDVFSDVIVVVGMFATGLDTLSTPVETNSPGVAVHAAAITNILENDYLTKIPIPFEVLLRFSALLIIFAAVRHLSPAMGIPVSMGIVIVFVALIWAVFVFGNLWIPLATPLTGAIGMIIGVSAYRLNREDREKQFIKKTFSNLLSRNVLETLLQHPENLKLGGTRQELTVLFADIRNFTTFCESCSPEEVVIRLNEILEVLTPIIRKHDGTLDKYIGDAIMAFWGAPAAQSDHAQRAVTAAIEMSEAVDELAQRTAKDGGEPMRMGIGINTGQMLVGYTGSSQMMSYTVIGDEVNLASRLEGLTRKFDCTIIIGETTHAAVRDKFLFTDLGEVEVKGKTKPVRVYSVIPSARS